MSVTYEGAPGHQVPRLDLELTSACDHRCGHCYNVWNADEGDAQAGYPKGSLPTDEYLELVEKAVGQTGAQHITITGGEPLLHKGAMQIIERACALVDAVQLITNGSHVGPERAAKFKAWGLRSVQLTLLSADRALHDRLKGSECFDDTLRAALDLRDAGVAVQVCFVAMKANAGELRGVMELCVALGVRAITYNRMSPTGWAIHQLDALLPEVEAVERDLDLAERLGREWGIRVATAMPVLPCLIRITRYRWVKFGLCSTGTHSPNIVIDATGNVRSCNLSSHIMGNLRTQNWPEVHSDPYLHTFREQVPELCRGCAYERSCQGGCKESGFATYGSLSHPEPFLHRALGGGSEDPLVQIGG